MEILLGDLTQNWGERIFSNQQLGNESLHQDSNDNGVRIVNFATSKNLVVKSTMFPTETFISTPGPLMMGRLTTRLITY